MALMMTLLHLWMILCGLHYEIFLFVGIQGGGSEFRANWTTLAAGVQDANPCRHPAFTAFWCPGAGLINAHELIDLPL